MRQKSLIVDAAYGNTQLDRLLDEGWEVVQMCPFISNSGTCATGGKILVILQNDEPEKKPGEDE